MSVPIGFLVGASNECPPPRQVRHRRGRLFIRIDRPGQHMGRPQPHVALCRQGKSVLGAMGLPREQKLPGVHRASRPPAVLHCMPAVQARMGSRRDASRGRQRQSRQRPRTRWRPRWRTVAETRRARARSSISAIWRAIYAIANGIGSATSVSASDGREHRERQPPPTAE